MLEYDDEISRNNTSIYYQRYTEGFSIGLQSTVIHFMRSLMKKYTDNQILGKDPVTEDDKLLIKVCEKNRKEELLNFIHKYERFNDEQLAERYIYETEFLPWR